MLPVRPDGALGDFTQLLDLPGPVGPHRTEQACAHPHHIVFDPSGRQYSGRWWSDHHDRAGDWNGWRQGMAQNQPPPYQGYPQGQGGGYPPPQGQGGYPPPQGGEPNGYPPPQGQQQPAPPAQPGQPTYY